MRWMPLLLFLAGCFEPTIVERPVTTSAIGDGPALEAGRSQALVPYAEVRAQVEADRLRLSRMDRPLARGEARKVLIASVRDGLIPHWDGTPWDFYGTTTVPGEGVIACGYFVSTVLQHTGLQVERVRMAQQASAHIAMSFERDLRVFRAGDEAAVVHALLAEGEGIYVVGFDAHVGLVVVRDEHAEFCHSSWLGASGVQCTDPLHDAAFRSALHVYSPVLTDAVVDAWLDGTAIPTVTRGRIP